MKEPEKTPSGYLPMMNRRSFISASIAFALVGGVPLITREGSALNVEQNTQQLIDKLLSVMRDEQSAVQVGKVILTEQDDRFQLPTLVSSIMDNLGLSFDNLRSIKRTDLVARLNSRTVLDFDSGAIVDAAGWMLGQTEAQLCVLAAKADASPFFRIWR